MDVGDPSNFARLAALHGEIARAPRAPMSRRHRITEDETRGTIRDVYAATATCSIRTVPWAWPPRGDTVTHAANTAPVVSLATAHPAKFGDVIRQELGFEPALPAHYRDWASRPVLADTLADTGYDTFRRWLLALD